MEAAVRHQSRLALLFISVAITTICVWRLARKPVDLHAMSMAPILPVNFANGEPSFLAIALRDPEALRHRPEDELDASRLAQEIKEFRSDLSRAKGARQLELHDQAYQGYASLSYYLEDVAAGITTGDRKSARQNLEAIRNFLSFHATSTAQLSRDPSQRSRALYHALITQYLSGRDRARAARGLRELTKGSARLDPSLKARAEFVASIQNVDSGGYDKASLQSLAKAAKSLSGPGTVAARLALARGYAGLSKDGRKRARPDQTYRSHLAAAARAAESLSPPHKDETLSLIIGIWRRAESGADWSKPPFAMSGFAGSLAVKGIVERNAINDWHRWDHGAALRKYKSLAKSMNGQAHRGDLDLRILDIRRIEYVKSRNPKAYEAELLSQQKAYLDPELLGSAEKTKAVASVIQDRHAALVYGEMARVSTRTASVGERRRAIGLGQTYVQILGVTKNLLVIKAKMAQLYSLNGEHRDAVAIYRELAETGSDAKKYYSLAIASQSLLARWPAEAPWRGFADGELQAREELFDLYEKFAKLSGEKKTWSLVAQQGLLLTSLGKVDEAFDLWNAQLKLDPKGPHAANASGYMLVAHQKSKRWDSLEATARICIAANITPIYRSTRLSARESLGLALLEGGSLALQENQFAVASTKLGEFVNKHAQHSRHDEGMFKLAFAFRGNNQHKDAITTLIGLVERHASSKYRRDALLLGGDWSAPMAFEENAMFFYQKFLSAYAQDPEADRVRVTATELYVGRGLYQQATAVLMARVESPGVSAAEKSTALATILDLEERHGAMSRANKAADLILAAGDAAPDHKADAYALKANLAAKAGDLNRLHSIETQLAQLGSTASATEVRGQVRYLIASAQSRDLVQEYFNLELKDPLKTLAGRYAAWQKVRSAYEGVCAPGATSACAPAMHDLARLAVQFLRSIEDIDVQATLAQDTVRKFQAHKQFIYNDVSKAAQRADAKALASVHRGETEPDTTQAVLWQNASDWNFERVSGEAGNAYVQWSTGMTAEAE